MSRVKRGVTTHRRHKKILALARGHHGQRHRVFRRANESVMHALRYSYEDRRARKGDFRRLWITRINAAARQNGMSYSRFVAGLNEAGVEINRKMLAEMAVNDPDAFSQLVKIAQQA
jgi:large subunit ribosomal protein L20